MKGEFVWKEIYKKSGKGSFAVPKRFCGALFDFGSVERAALKQA